MQASGCVHQILNTIQPPLEMHVGAMITVLVTTYTTMRSMLAINNFWTAIIDGSKIPRLSTRTTLGSGRVTSLNKPSLFLLHQ